MKLNQAKKLLGIPRNKTIRGQEQFLEHARLCDVAMTETTENRDELSKAKELFLSRANEMTFRQALSALAGVAPNESFTDRRTWPRAVAICEAESRKSAADGNGILAASLNRAKSVFRRRIETKPAKRGVELRKAKKLAGIVHRVQTQAELEAAIAHCETLFRKEHPDAGGNAMRAADLKQAQEIFKRYAHRNKCIVCESRIGRGATHCQIHQPGRTRILIPPSPSWQPEQKRKSNGNARIDVSPKGGPVARFGFYATPVQKVFRKWRTVIGEASAKTCFWQAAAILNKSEISLATLPRSQWQCTLELGASLANVLSDRTKPDYWLLKLPFQVATVESGNAVWESAEAIRQNARATLARMKSIAPDAFTAAETARDVIVAKTAEFYAAIDGARTAIGALETALVSRGELLRGIAADESALADAKARLDSPEVLNTAPEFVLRLTHVARFFPDKIAADKADARRLESEARAIVKDNDLALPALIKVLLAEARNAEGRIVNSQIITLHAEGFLNL